MNQWQRFENRIRSTGPAVLTRAGQQDWLDRPSYRLEHALTFLFATLGRNRDRVSNALHGTWLGHPLHPALTSVPTGAVATTLVMDAASVLPGSAARLRDGSRFTLGVALVGSVGAAATGMTDWQHTHEQSRRIGLVHGALNAIATALYAASWWDRHRGRHRRGMVSSALGYGLTLAGGYLGGALVFGAGTGVNRSGARLGGDRWMPVLRAAALDGQPRRVAVDGVGVVLYRTEGRVVAVGERCPHLGAPMSDGWIDRGRIVCPWHGSRFACGSGDVLRGPATAPLPNYPVRIRDGFVEVHGVAK
ncbi:(2Fe-2S)-binding protein [Mycobacterium sp. 852002-51971_SCH5477799-a]|uniref:Rieske 2Fe-2S domain-containing protein n=1 Tax=Mycobacterium sp. 852002-51971_SCH5477799-a TaxID=1834106 RepID=UPI0007FF5DD5|nr:Rieske 2Fe-2S domain-containing protein [Mycobacterium sp. 852002-51971_SCH5477799-a]OBF63361.1 (2Fe-2S)-binding protein [Mycobacterium sp. 852002-51971_SCH5477799-a]